ncbi:MAG: hypothetical protein ACFFBD_21095 [Candidatus Hodarchaeota archaeon]
MIYSEPLIGCELLPSCHCVTQEVRFTDFTYCYRSVQELEGFMSTAIFKLDAEYRLDPEAILQISKVVVEYEDNLIPKSLEKSVQGIDEKIDLLKQDQGKLEYTLKQQQELLELIAQKVGATMESE